MTGNDLLMGIGAVCFGLVVGYITYRTLIRSESTGVSDLAAVIGAIGGGVVTTLYDPQVSGDLFAWYAIGLALGFVVYGGLFGTINGIRELGLKMNGDKVRRQNPTVND